jgi:DNA end-binding protein Ku
VSEKEVKMAQALIDSMTSDDFEPEKFRDTYREKVLELIEKKAAGEVIAAPTEEEAQTPVADLMAALEASVAAAKSRRSGG